MVKLVGMVAATALLAGAAGAQPFNGAHQIMRGHWAAAERDLTAAHALQPADVDLMLNLATVYANTGRPLLARAMYRQVAAMPDEDLVTANGATIGSRALAARAMANVPAAVAAN